VVACVAEKKALAKSGYSCRARGSKRKLHRLENRGWRLVKSWPFFKCQKQLIKNRKITHQRLTDNYLTNSRLKRKKLAFCCRNSKNTHL